MGKPEEKLPDSIPSEGSTSDCVGEFHRFTPPYVTVFASIVAYLSWNFGVRVLGANQASMFNFLIPVFSALIAIPVLGEGLQTYHLVGAGFIFTSLWLSNRH